MSGERDRNAEEMRNALLGAIEDFFDRQAAGTLPAPAPSRPPRPSHDCQVAAAILMLFLVRADHEVVTDEHRALEQALRRHFGLTADETAMLVRAAEQALGAGARLHELASAMNASMSAAEKKDVVRGLWRVAYADAELQAHEEYLVRKVAVLFGLSSADLMETKLAAREEFLRDDL